MNSNENQLSGYLKVKGTWGTHSKFWFVLKGTMLARYKTPKDATPQDTLELNNKQISIMNAEGITGKKLTIGIFVASKSPVIIITASEEEFQCWLSKLQAACNTGAQVSKDATESVVSTMEAVLDASVVADEKCNILGFNKAAEALFGFTKQEVVGMNVKLLMPDAYAAVHDKYVHSYNKTGHKKLIGMPRQLIAKRKDGSTTPVHVSLGEIAQYKTGECKAAFVALIRHVTLQHSNPSTPKPSALEFSPTLKRSDSEDSVVSLDENHGRRGSIDTQSNSSAGMNLDFGTAIKKVERKMNEKIIEALQSIQQGFKEELEDLDKKYLVSQHKNEILESENNRLNGLVGKLTDDNARLLEEVKVLQKNSATSQILQVLRKNSTYLSFLAFCQQRKSPEPAMFYNEAELYTQKFKSMNPDEAKKEATCIYKKYLDQGSPFQLNTRTALTDHVKKHLQDPSQHLFNLLQDEIVHELNHELFKEFTATAQGKYALAELDL